MSKNKAKSYIEKSLKEVKLVFEELHLAYKNCEKISKNSNLIGLLMHELAFFLFTNISVKNIKKRNDLVKNVEFFKRNGVKIFVNKKNYKRCLFNWLTKFFFLKKKILITEYLPLKKIDIFKLVIYAFIKGYRPFFGLENQFYFDKINEQKKILFSTLLKINKKYKININIEKIKKEINQFINNHLTSRDNIGNYDICITGTSGKIYNRISSSNGLQKRKKVILVGHNKSSFSHGLDQKFDDYSLCSDLIGDGPYGNHKLKNHKFLLPMGKNKLNFYSTSLTNHTHKNKINDLSYNQFINSNKGVYISGRIGPLNCIGSRVFNPKDYIFWQEIFLNNFKNIHIKYHPKQKINLPKHKNKEIEGRLQDITKEYDFFVLDSPDSSSFAEIAITDKPIVFFDLGYMKLNQSMSKLLKHRSYYFKINLEEKINFKNFNLIFGKKKNNNFSKNFCYSLKAKSKIQTLLNIID